jgi:hypothetical protein
MFHLFRVGLDITGNRDLLSRRSATAERDPCEVSTSGTVFRNVTFVGAGTQSEPLTGKGNGPLLIFGYEPIGIFPRPRRDAELSCELPRCILCNLRGQLAHQLGSDH